MKKIIVISLVLFLNLFFALGSYADTVVYNVKTGKIHSPSCQYAKKCTVNCIKIERKEAVRRGGVPCKVCGSR